MTTDQFTDLLLVLKRIEEKVQDLAKEQEMLSKQIYEYSLRTPYNLITKEEFDKAVDVARHNRLVSSAVLQRLMQIGYAKSSTLVTMLEDEGCIAKIEGAKPRKSLIYKQQH